MNEPLHPSSLGEILDRTAQLYRSRFLVFLGISLIPTGVVVALACVVGLVVAWWSAAGAGSVARETGFALVGLFGIGVALVALPTFLAAIGAGRGGHESRRFPGLTSANRRPSAMPTRAAGGAAGGTSGSICLKPCLSGPLPLPFGLRWSSSPPWE
jgi:hypothetical protein